MAGSDVDIIPTSFELYERGNVSRLGEHAIVVGGSVAGLLAARVLSDAFEEVTVLDRDSIEEGTSERRGVPQAKHPHALLAGGQLVMEDLLPGLTDELMASGALTLDLTSEVSMHAADGFLAPGSTTVPIHFASRPLLEQLLRHRVSRLEGVSLIPDSRVAGLLSEDGATIEGVEFRANSSERALPADLVVDATGRTSRFPTWLEELGYPPPSTETVHVNLTYRTCQVARPPEDRRAMLIFPFPPRTRGGFLAPVEGNRWLVTLSGIHGDDPPDDLEGLREFAASLPDPTIRQLLDEREMLTSDVAFYRFPTNTRQRYDQVEKLPPGFLAIGDAIASFNPIYGQGMSVAALEALALHHTLGESDHETLASAFYKRVWQIVDDAWNISSGGDFAFPQTYGAKPAGTNVVNRYISRLHRKAHTDGRLVDAFSRVAAMLDRPTSLFSPGVAWRVLRP